MRAFILAGGFATRLWPLTEKRAKPLLPIAGRPLISHLVESLPKDLPITVSTNAAFAEGFRAWAAALERRVELVVERTANDSQKLGALGALAAWVQEERIDDDVLVLTGDNHLGFRMEDFLARFDTDPLVAAHDIGDLARASAFGTVVLDPLDPPRVAAFEEKPKAPKTTLVSAGCAVLPRAALPVLLEYAALHPDNVGGIFEELLHRGARVEAFVFTEPWIDIGSFQTYLDAHRLLVGAKPVIGAGSSASGCEVQGSVCVGSGCRLERSTLIDCIVFDGCVITDCTLRNCVVDDRCVLSGIDLQNQMLRAGTRLELP